MACHPVESSLFGGRLLWLDQVTCMSNISHGLRFSFEIELWSSSSPKDNHDGWFKSIREGRALHDDREVLLFPYEELLTFDWIQSTISTQETQSFGLEPGGTDTSFR